MSGSTYRRVPTGESGLPAPSTSEGPRSGLSARGAAAASALASPLLNRIGHSPRRRWAALAGAATLVVILFLTLTPSSEEGPSRLRTAAWGNKNANPWFRLGAKAPTNGQWNDQAFEAGGWVQGSGRKNLTYDSPFNREDYSLTEDECDAFFPGLWKEIDRSVEYFTTKQKFDKEYLEFVCDDGIWSNARVVIYENQVYLKHYKQSDFTRSQAALHLLHLSVMTARERLPNVEFCVNLVDWGSRGKFGLDRSPDLQDVWLMPDYGWFAWPEHVGSYKDYRRRAAKVEQEVGWSGKVDKLFWRGSMRVGTADRESMKQMSDGHAWSDVEEVRWGDGATNAVTMEDHCRWKFHGFPEGNTYSGRLRYLQNCRVVIVTHPPRWIQHWTHLYNADPNSPDQNIVYVDPPAPDAPSVLVHDEKGNEFRDATWHNLPATMDWLLRNDERAKLIADNQWDFFRERYISPASATCYWRKLIKGFASVQLYDVDLSGSETPYETWLLGGHRLKGESGMH
ncbi:hypothetical protein BDZ90DRAFT_57048 [Jaminaea rosea]|uniref:Glycosyl transferase CAP10 domain-containing protein n=1 Tax=Jaminaea rosea TaxID=1569628 RepID=A0A316UL74_9BASI|nr:hypothetical protein BDZ90DRAFT_57048 [Jaminaea rosea]PWN26042.1 hypothetical protein BDZ90DRAFT_57048 [Jaminaea rosea]